MAKKRNEILSISENELEQFLIHKLQNKSIFDNLAYHCDLAESWIEPIGVLTSLLARVLEAKMNSDPPELLTILIFFMTCQKVCIYLIEEMDFIFVEHLVRTIRQPTFSLEDDLVDINSKLMDHD